ncbi:MAG: hypothetical protein RIC89_18865 [Pseudomonadales bacterium]
MADPELSEVFRKIGRNVVSFQKLEGLLKYLAAAPNYKASTLDEIQEARDKHISGLRKKSFGLTVQDFFNDVYPEASANEEEDEELFAFNFRIRGGDRERLLTAIQRVVEERNELVHTRLTSFDSESAQYRAELATFLDQQFERLKPVYEEIDQLVQAMRIVRKETVKQLDELIASRGDAGKAPD